MTIVTSRLHIYNNFLSSIDLFKNIDSHKLAGLFNSVKVNQFYPGEIINLNCHERDGCYIVYKGMVKLTKMSDKGDEIIIDLYEKGDVISPMFLAKNYNINAEFFKGAVLFYFSRPLIDNFAKNNYQFTLNIISLLSIKLQKMMDSVEILHLKTDKERVARYLARSKASGILKLRHPKALIASCLGMRPESFSRAIYKLKEEGIYLNNKTIHLENGSELRQYM